MQKDELSQKRNLLCSHCFLYDHECEGWQFVDCCPLYLGIDYMQNLKDDLKRLTEKEQ